LSIKTCKQCGVDKELTEFYVSRRNLDGRMGKCKLCVKSNVRENRRNRREQYAQYERSRANLPHRIEVRRKYQEEHRERLTEFKERWTKENGERVAASKREHYDRNRKAIIVRSKKWAEENSEKVRIAKAKNRRKRRAARYAGRGSFTAREFQELCDRYGNRCLRCGNTHTMLEADHVVPLTKGGSDEISNIQPLCGSCNRSKFVDTLDYRVAVQ
jgi:5-methylcytosine-specific restriction endonuclease McrA